MSSPSPSPSTATPGPSTIVVIDDSVDLVESVLMLLELEGYRALGATDGPAGIRIAEEVRADLVVLDFMLPDMNGAAIGKVLRAHPFLGGVRIVMCSATPEATVRRSFTGYDVFLTKPVFPETFFATMREQLSAAPRPGAFAP
ncbi:MAG: response regulator [Caldimonas sp.]